MPFSFLSGLTDNRRWIKCELPLLFLPLLAMAFHVPEQNNFVAEQGIAKRTSKLRLHSALVSHVTCDSLFPFVTAAATGTRVAGVRPTIGSVGYVDPIGFCNEKNTTPFINIQKHFQDNLQKLHIRQPHAKSKNWYNHSVNGTVWLYFFSFLFFFTSLVTA